MNMGMKRSAEHVKIQRKGRERDCNVCQFCGEKVKPEGHHIIDYQFGGAANIENIVTFCQKCHKKVHKGMIDLIKF